MMNGQGSWVCCNPGVKTVKESTVGFSFLLGWGLSFGAADELTNWRWGLDNIGTRTF